MLYFTPINRAISELRHIAVRWSRSPESLPHGMFPKTFDSGHSTIEMSFGRARPHNYLINGSLVSQIEKSGKYREKQDYIEAFFFVFMPNAFE